MKTMKIQTPWLAAGALTSLLLAATPAWADTLITTTGSVAYASLAAAGADLINQGQGTYASAAGTATSMFDSNGSALADALILNNGAGDAGNEGSDNYPGGAQNTYTLNLDPLTGGSAAGYNITSIVVTSGRGNSGCSRDTQFYDPAVTATGLVLQYSYDLASWNPAATSPDGSVVATKLADAWSLDIAQDTHPHAFFRLYLNEIMPAAP